MENTVQNNPGNAADGDVVWPDWNSKYGTGANVEDGARGDFVEIHEAQRSGEKERLEARKPRDPGLA